MAMEVSAGFENLDYVLWMVPVLLNAERQGETFLIVETVFDLKLCHVRLCQLHVQGYHAWNLQLQWDYSHLNIQLTGQFPTV